MRPLPGTNRHRHDCNTNWQQYHHHQQHNDNTAPLQSHYNQPQNFHPQLLSQQFRATVAPATMQRDIVKFIETFRATQSSLTAPPNTLTLDIMVQAICNHFHVTLFEDLMGKSALQLPILRQVHTVNQRVWTFVTCFIQSRRIHTLMECHQAFLQHEGLQSFHELKIGNSFLHTEAVQCLYHSPIAVTNITTREVLGCLRQYEDMMGQDAFRASSHIHLHEFAQFLAHQYRQPSIQAMGVVIDPSGFGVYVGMLRRIANYEIKEMKTLEQQFQCELAEKIFRLTKEKFSDANRKQALDELLQQTNAGLDQHEKDDENLQNKKRRSKKDRMQSLSLDMLQRVTHVDVYLDNLLRRKAAKDAKGQQGCVNSISSQKIAEIDSKLRNQLARFLVSSQKSRHHSRLKVVTWVICSIMAKTHALLVSDDKLPDDDGVDGEKIKAAHETATSDRDECDCCCVGKDSCTCPCTCKCHVESSDEEDENNDYQGKTADVGVKPDTSSNTDSFPVMPADPFASSLGKVTPEVNVTLEEVTTEAENFLSIQQSRVDHPQTAKDMLLHLSSLENHLLSKFSVKRSSVSWAGRKSILEVLSHIVSDAEDQNNAKETSVGKWLHGLVRSSNEDGNDACTSKATSEKYLLDEVVSFVRECRTAISSSSALSSFSSEKQLQWIAHRVSVQFECVCTEERGLPSVEELVKLADQQSYGEETSVIKYAGSLDLNMANGRFNDAVTRVDTTGESMPKFVTEQAIEKLRKCPYLVDVSLYMDWQEQYAPMCGSLLSFIRVHEMILLDHASSTFMCVCCLNGTILRVNEKSTPSDLEVLFARAQQEQIPVAASQVAIHLVSLMVTCTNQANFPKQLVQAFLRAFLSKVVKDWTVDSYGPRFVLEVLLETPIEFADFVMSLLLSVVGQDRDVGVSNDWDVADQVWQACQIDAERKVLVFISHRSMSPLWAEQTQKWCTVRKNLTIASVADEGGSCDDLGSDVTKTKTALPTDASKSNDKNDNMISNVLDTSGLEVALAHFSTNKLLHRKSEDEPPAESVTSAVSCYSFIEDLRKKQFGVCLQVQDEATTSVLLIQQQRLERALKRLSDELYSESTHFVLELLQNADDNAYDDDVIPLGDFSLTADNDIVFYNNERGFLPENIQAICDVGTSTKATVHSEASIGKKGIGFKSVFKVSDNPQVHSNGFHICFHAKDSQHGNSMGYILPYWLDDTTQWKRRRGTTFVLPLNETSMHRVNDISQSLLAFEPSVLLFLRRIRELRFRDLARQHTLHFLKQEIKLQPDIHVVQLFSQVTKSENGVDMVQQNWLVVKEKLEPPPLFSRSHLTEIAVALPVAAQHKESCEQADRPPLQQVFAYLPLRSYGLRFILQGDFEIPSSREAIITGSEWNEWLVSKFPTLLRAAVSSYISSVERDEKGNAKSSGNSIVGAVLHLISLLPLENEVQPPFRSIIPEVMRELRHVKWLAVASLTPSSSSVGQLLTPSELIDCTELTGNEVSENMTTLMEALSYDVVTSMLNKRFLHPTLSGAMSSLMKNQLRIEQLHSSHLMRILSLSAEMNNIDWTAKILTLLAKLWRKDRRSTLLRQELRLIKCFPLEQKSNVDGIIRWISLAEGHDSLFICGVHAVDTVSNCGESRKFYDDLRILDTRFTKTISESSRLRTFLTNDVGIYVMEDHKLIEHYVLPKMALLRSHTDGSNGNDTGKLDIEVVIEYGQFLSSHLASCSNCPMYAGVKASMVVAATSSRMLSVGTSNLFVVLPSTFKELPQLVSWFTTKAKTAQPDENTYAIVSGDYFLNNDSKPKSYITRFMDKQWQELLVDVCDLPLLFDTASLMSDPRSQTGMKQILKWIEVEADIAVKRSISKHLAEYMDKHWRADEGSYDPSSSNSIVSTNVESNTFDWWRQHYWLEGSDGDFHRSIDLCMSIETMTRLFTPSMVTFASMAWTNRDFSERVLGMKADASVSDVLSTISSLSVDSTVVSALETDQMVRLYTFLWEKSQHSNACRAKIMEAFSRKLMLFVSAEVQTSGKKSRNYFTGIKNAVWSLTAHNGKLFALETQYPKALSAFFIEVCGVHRKPSVSFLCELITGQVFVLANPGRSKRSEKLKLWEKKLLPLLCALFKKVKKRLLSQKETRMAKKTLNSIPWLPVRCVNRSQDGLLFCKLEEQPVLATTEIEKKLQKLMLSLSKEISVDLDVSLNEANKVNDDDIKLIQLHAFSNDGDLDALLGFANISTISAHIECHASSWCKAFARFTKSSQLDSKKGRKNLLKLGQLLVTTWANVFSSSSPSVGEQEIQWSVQHLSVFPTIDDNLCWTSATDLYINDQAELSKQDLQQQAKSACQLKVLGLFSWNYWVDKPASEDRSSETTRVYKFLTNLCGMKSLKKHLQYDVSVLSTQHVASAAFHDKIRIAFAVAQRYLFHCHRHLYDQLHHDSIAKLASEIQCILVDGHDGFQVVYRIGNSFSLRRGANALSRCFLDVANNTLYIQSVTGDEEGSVLSVVLMELSRKLFGAQVASSVANLLYLSLLQSDSTLREQWLVETQLLPPYSAGEAGSLWVEQFATTSSIANDRCRKRTSKDIEDGGIAAEVGPAKKHYASMQNDKTRDTLLHPLAPAANNYDMAENEESHGMYMQRPPYPPLPPSSGNNDGALYRSTLAPSSSFRTGMQSLSLSNTLSKEEREAIGRWGEEYVYNQLKQQHADIGSNLIVNWVNEKEESGLPYDLTLSSGNTVVEYIEVKSTRTMEKGVFEISMNELDQAAIHGSTYCIYRVFNAGNFALCRVIRMKNPVSLVRQRKIQLALVMQ